MNRRSTCARVRLEFDLSWCTSRLEALESIEGLRVWRVSIGALEELQFLQQDRQAFGYSKYPSDTMDGIWYYPNSSLQPAAFSRLGTINLLGGFLEKSDSESSKGLLIRNIWILLTKPVVVRSEPRSPGTCWMSMARWWSKDHLRM